MPRCALPQSPYRRHCLTGCWSRGLREEGWQWAQPAYRIEQWPDARWGHESQAEDPERTISYDRISFREGRLFVLVWDRAQVDVVTPDAGSLVLRIIAALGLKPRVAQPAITSDTSPGSRSDVRG